MGRDLIIDDFTTEGPVPRRITVERFSSGRPLAAVRIGSDRNRVVVDPAEAHRLGCALLEFAGDPTGTEAA